MNKMSTGTRIECDTCNEKLSSLELLCLHFKEKHEEEDQFEIERKMFQTPEEFKVFF